MRALVGAELPMEDGSALPVLAASRAGYQTIGALLTTANLRAEKGEDGQVYRTLQTGSDFQYVAKDRSGALGFYEEPNLASIATKILTSV